MDVDEKILTAIAMATAKFGSIRSLAREMGNESYAAAISILKNSYHDWKKGKRRKPPCIGDARWKAFWHGLRDFLDPSLYAPLDERAAAVRATAAAYAPSVPSNSVPIFSQEEARFLPHSVILGDELPPANRCSEEREFTVDPAACAAFRVQGQFMDGQGIIDGSVVLAKRAKSLRDIPDGTIVCCKYEGEFWVRQLFHAAKGATSLICTNAVGRPIIIPKGDQPEWFLVATRSTKDLVQVRRKAGNQPPLPMYKAMILLNVTLAFLVYVALRMTAFSSVPFSAQDVYLLLLYSYGGVIFKLYWRSEESEILVPIVANGCG